MATEKVNDKVCDHATQRKPVLHSQKGLPHLKQAVLQKQLHNNWQQL